MCKKPIRLFLASIIICSCVSCKSEVNLEEKSSRLEEDELSSIESEDTADATTSANTKSQTEHTMTLRKSTTTSRTSSRKNSTTLKSNTTSKNSSKTSSATAKTTTISVQRWVTAEIDFISDKEYDTSVYDVDMDVVFTHKNPENLEAPGLLGWGQAVDGALRTYRNWGVELENRLYRYKKQGPSRTDR